MKVLVIYFMIIVAAVESKKCEPAFKCPPGHEIMKCSEYGGKRDVCVRCSVGKVQPNFVSSFDNPNTCFLPLNKCTGQDVTYARKQTTTTCNYGKFCKCDTTLCFFGDSCLCDRNWNGCPPDNFLNNNGTCVFCPRGMSKAGYGCGPCFHYNTKKRLVKKRRCRKCKKRRVNWKNGSSYTKKKIYIIFFVKNYI